MGPNTPTLRVRVTSTAHDLGSRILAADFAQAVMILVTVAVATTYGWIEGYVINAQLGNQQLLPYVLFNHFTVYQIAVGLILGLVTSGFALVKSTQMFARGKRYVLFSFLGNYPLSWVVEDFTYFLFNPLDALSTGHWSTWFLGGVYAYSPWLPGNPKPEFFIPTWYFLAFAWFLGCQWYAHRCTVYDNLLKDEIGRQILPKLPTSKMDEDAAESPARVPAAIPTPKPSPTSEAPIDTVVPTPVDTTKSITPPERATKVRSAEAEAALQRLREKWLKKT